ncbi:hypothetical protein ACKKBF_B08820 [Auxenochlorella protothecoides x Auxenochlorella symbiontica]
MLASASTRVLSTSGPQRFGSIISRRTGVMVCVAAQPSAPEALEESPFPRLGRNAALYKEVGGGKKFRQHVNPLKKELATPPPPPDWAAVYADPGLPLTVDVGAGYGRFLLGLAQTGAAGGLRNHLGFEIRGSVVDRAQDWAAALGVARSVHFVLANATLSLGPVLRSYPGRLDLVTIQFPDPQFKRRHRKRRIVQRGLVDSVAELMPRGGRVFLQSDVLEVAEDMRDHFLAHPAFSPAPGHDAPDAVFHARSRHQLDMGLKGNDKEGCSGGEEGVALGEPPRASLGWLRENPLGMPTEREVLTQRQGGAVYRVLLERR